MEQIRIKPITESDIDEIVVACGGRRIEEEDSADYLFKNSVIELKLIEEEGFSKKERQQKIAALFRMQQPNVPVVVMEPSRLLGEELKKYRRALEGPIKTAVKKAADQLPKTADRYDSSMPRVLIILNIGYTAVTHEEFEQICVKCARNDTQKIDTIICGGIYFHSDTFDNYVFTRFEQIPINLNRSPQNLDLLADAWGKLVERKLTEVVTSHDPFSDGKMPVLDFSFSIDGVRYVKPAPRMPKSGFWPGGRKPRENSSGITRCPPVAKTFPMLSLAEWTKFKRVMPQSESLQPTYSEWLQFQANEERDFDESRRPFVPIPLSFEEFSASTHKLVSQWKFGDLCEYANTLFERKVREVVSRASDVTVSNLYLPSYLLLVLEEIGQDEANDLCSIYLVSESADGEQKRAVLIENENIFFMYALAIASAYAVKHRMDFVRYERVQA